MESTAYSKHQQDKEFKVCNSTFIQYKKDLIEKDYKIAEVIGNGAFATVRKVYHKTTGQPRALKIKRQQCSYVFRSRNT